MKKDNYILSVIDEITEVLQKNEYVRERYYNDVAWLQEKAKFIKKNIRLNKRHFILLLHV